MNQRVLIAAALAVLLVVAACSSDGEVAEVASLEEAPTAESQAEPDSEEATSESTAENTTTTADEEEPAESSEDSEDLEFTTPLLDEERREGIPTTSPGYVVALYGDSVAKSIEEKLVTYLDWGLRIETLSRAFPGSATCAFQPELERDAASGLLWGAVLLYSNNLFPECMWDEDGEPLSGEAAWDKFAVDMTLAVEALVDEGIRVYLPTLALTRSEVDDERPASQRVNEVVAQLADDYELAFLIDAAPSVLGPDGNYVEYLPCLQYEPCLNGTTDDGTPVNLVRKDDGAHFCTGGFEDYEAQEGLCPAWASGQFRYGLAVAQPIIEDAYAEFTGTG